MNNINNSNKTDLLVNNPFESIKNDWSLIVVNSNNNQANVMTASWIMKGFFWNKEVLMIFIRPSRYTNELINNSNYFTVSFFDNEYKESLKLCGSKSGRDINKIKECNLNLVIDSLDSNKVYIKEAKQSYICKKIYKDKINKESILDEEILKNYFNDDYHFLYIGEIIEVIGK